MDIVTKFNIGDEAFFLMSVDSEIDVKLFKVKVTKIDISMDESDDEPIINYTVAGYSGNIVLGNDTLFRNHKEVIEYLFKDTNMRTYLNKNHKFKKKKEIPFPLDNDLIDSLIRNDENLSSYTAHAMDTMRRLLELPGAQAPSTPEHYDEDPNSIL